MQTIPSKSERNKLVCAWHFCSMLIITALSVMTGGYKTLTPEASNAEVIEAWLWHKWSRGLLGMNDLVSRSVDKFEDAMKWVGSVSKLRPESGGKGSLNYGDIYDEVDRFSVAFDNETLAILWERMFAEKLMSGLPIAYELANRFYERYNFDWSQFDQTKEGKAAAAKAQNMISEECEAFRLFMAEQYAEYKAFVDGIA